MKIKNIISLVLFIGIVFLISSCVGTAAINDEYMIQPDPNNVFQGTWVGRMGSVDVMHVIDGMNGTWYVRGGVYTRVWQKRAVYMIEKKGDEYVTSNNWRIRVDGDILTVENMTYERFLGKK